MSIIDFYIKKFESDKIPISEVFNCWTTILNSLNEVNTLTVVQTEYLRIRINKRWDFIRSDAHMISFLLDPRFGRQLMDDEDVNRIMDLAISYINPDPDRDSYLSIYEQLIKYFNHIEDLKTSNHAKYQLLVSGKLTIMELWKYMRSPYPLLDSLMTKIFSLVCSTASTERNWSLQGLIHNKFRSRLDPDKVMKLAFVKSNFHLVSESKDRTIIELSSNEELSEME